jgi:hypothetical protein
MKKLTALACFLLTTIPAFAEVGVADLRVLRHGQSYGISVNLFNNLTVRQGGPITIILFVRQHPTDTWQKLKEWDDVSFIAPYGRVNKAEDNNPVVQKLAETGGFEAMVQVSAPGQPDAQKQTSFVQAVQAK